MVICEIPENFTLEEITEDLIEQVFHPEEEQEKQKEIFNVKVVKHFVIKTTAIGKGWFSAPNLRMCQSNV